MLPIELAATTAATLFATGAIEGIGDRVTQSATERLGHLIGFIKDKLSGDASDREVLAQVETAPEDQRKVEALAAVLHSHAAESPSFYQELEDLVAQARREPSLGRFVTTVSDNARVGKLTNIETVHGDVSF